MKSNDNPKNDIINPKKLFECKGGGGHRQKLYYLSNGYLAWAGNSVMDAILIYDSKQKTNEEVAYISLSPVRYKPFSYALASLPGARLVISDTQGLKIWHAETKSTTPVNDLHAIKIEYAGNNNLICQMYDTNEIVIFNLSSPNDIKKLCFSARGFATWNQQIFTSEDKEIKLWDLNGKNCGNVLVDEPIRFDQVNQQYVLSQDDKTKVFDLETKQVVSQCQKIPNPDVILLTYRHCIIRSSDIYLCDLQSGQVIKKINTGTISSMVLSPDNKLYCVNHENRLVEEFNNQVLQERQQATANGNPPSIPFCPMKRTVYTIMCLDFAPYLKQEFNQAKDTIADAVPCFPDAISSLTTEYVLGPWRMFSPQPTAHHSEDDETASLRP